jgi:hypothetical protein
VAGVPPDPRRPVVRQFAGSLPSAAVRLRELATDRTDDDVGDPLRPEHDVLPAEAEHPPPIAHQLVVPLAVPDEVGAGAVVLEAVRLEDDAAADVGEIDADTTSARELDHHLRLETGQAGVEDDATQSGLEGVGRPGVSRRRHAFAAPAPVRGLDLAAERSIARSMRQSPSAESAMANASSNGMVAAQSSTVRRTDVTGGELLLPRPGTASGDQWYWTPRIGVR